MMIKNNFRKIFFIFIILFVFLMLFFSFLNLDLTFGNKNYPNISEFKTGGETLFDSLNLLLDKRVAVITNQTGILPDGQHLVKALTEKNINIVRIFTPEHGFFSDDGYQENLFGIPVISLYDKQKNIKDEYLNDIDVLIYDIQDLGVRFYTYTSTLYLTMKDAKKNGIQFIICDRPAMHNLNYVSGFLLEPDFSSFVGMIPTPVCYGMTTGELGNYLKSVLQGNGNIMNLKIMKMQGYNRTTDFKNLNIKWVNPSPNIRNLESARLYPALCFLEGTNISEGRGTEFPFTLFGSPFCNSDLLLNELSKYSLSGVDFQKTEFTPVKDKSGYVPKYCNEKCYGIKITLTNFQEYKPMETAIAILLSLKNLEKNFKWINNNFIDKLAGTNKLRIMINNNESYNYILKSWQSDVENFKNKINKFLLY